MIDVRHYTSAVALQELQKHADLVRRVVIRTEDSVRYLPLRFGPWLMALSRVCIEFRLSVPVRQTANAFCVMLQLSPYLKVLTIQFDTVRDCVRPPIEHQNLIGEPEALFDLLMRLLEQKGDVEDPVDRVPWALLCCHVLRHLSLELPTARLHSTYSTLNANSVASELTRIELCCNAISLEGIIAFLVSPAAANLVSIKIKASLVGVPADFQPVLLTRLERLELATIARGSRRDSATDWPAFALPHLIDLSTPLKILILQSLSPQRIYCALTSFERAQPVKTLKHVRILAANEYWSTRCSSDFEALADELRNWTAQTGVKTEVIL